MRQYHHPRGQDLEGDFNVLLAALELAKALKRRLVLPRSGWALPSIYPSNPWRKFGFGPCRTMHCANSPAHVAYNSTFEEFGWFFDFFRCLLQTANHLNPVDIQGIPREQHGQFINRRIDWQGLHSGLLCFSKNFARNLDLETCHSFCPLFRANKS